jgi:phosphatidylglycerol:prolipoprotein diacylglycerol transferase
VLFGSWLGRKYVERHQMDDEELRFIGIRIIVIGFIGCHIFNAIFYEPDKLLGYGKYAAEGPDPLLLLRVWEGISSWGDVVSGAMAFFYYTHKRGLNRMRWADACAMGTIGGFLFGRLACSVVHDHIGYPSDFFLAVNFPADRFPGVPAHDIGLYEFFGLVPLFVAMLLLDLYWKKRPAGFLIAFMAIVYSAPRFFLENLRRPDSDPRYFGLTFGQFTSIFGLVVGIYLMRLAFKNRQSNLAEARIVAEGERVGSPVNKAAIASAKHAADEKGKTQGKGQAKKSQKKKKKKKKR